ncbi:MAG: SpoIIE family protein phosphatase [Candidatus Krumholzibacteriia bacterium]
MDPITVTLRGQLAGKPVHFELGGGVHLLGRAAECDLVVEEASVSRRHARVHVDSASVHVEDMGSSNGTRVGGILIDRPTQLRHADRLQLGNVVLAVELNGEASEVYLDQTQVRENLSVSIDEARSTHGGGGGKKAHLFRILAEAGSLLTHPGLPEEMFDPLLGLVEQALMPERVVLLLRDDDGSEPHIVASRVPSGDPGAMVISRTLMNRVLADQQAFLTEDASQDERLMGGESLVGARVRSAMAAPLFDNERVIGILYADSADPLVRYDRDELTAFVLLANVVGVAITHARYHAIEEDRRRLATELGAARLIMDRLLPRSLPEVAGAHLAVTLEPCEEVAGDLYDVRLLPDGRILVVIGDVSGKGLPAALLVAAMLPAIRVVAEDCGDLGVLAQRINSQLFEATDAVRFATLFLGRLDPASGRFEYVNAGHNPPLLRQDGEVHQLLACGPPVGMMPEMSYLEREINVAPGSVLVLYSDGLTEAQADDESMYGDDRLVELVRGCEACSADDLKRRILDDVAEFTGDAPQSDDLTLMLVQREKTSA